MGKPHDLRPSGYGTGYFVRISGIRRERAFKRYRMVHEPHIMFMDDTNTSTCGEKMKHIR